MDYPPHMKPYVEEQMRFDVAARFEQDFKVAHRGFSIETHPEQTPIVINNFNRLSYLQQLLEALRTRGYENIYIIDNCSTYEPLLDYYAKESLRVFRLDTNVGYLAIWRTLIHREFFRNYYVYTDPDIVPVDECPADFIPHFLDALERFPQVCKVGFGLKIDDLPEHYALRNEVVAHERQFRRLRYAPGLYQAPIDTTFALYRPRKVGGWWLPGIRTGEPYVARHLPWHADTSSPTDEERYYQETTQQSTHWTKLEGGSAR